jgi:hypothetical protein
VFLVLIALAPLGLYALGLSNVDGRPLPPAASSHLTPADQALLERAFRAPQPHYRRAAIALDLYNLNPGGLRSNGCCERSECRLLRCTTLQRASSQESTFDLVAFVRCRPDYLDRQTLDLRSSAQRSGGIGTAVGFLASEVVTVGANADRMHSRRPDPSDRLTGVRRQRGRCHRAENVKSQK